jgi:ribosomal protein S6--L-glutamate ligase
MWKIGVVGTRGGWSSEKLADTVEAATGYRLLIDMKEVRLDLKTGRSLYGDTELSQLDAVMIKKIGARYSPDLLDRLEVLRFLHERGMPMFSSPLQIMRVLDRLSCTVTMELAGIPMPPTTVTEDVEGALAAVEEYGEAVFKPLYSTKAKGMIVIRPGPGARAAVEEFQSDHPIMYIQKKIEHHGKDLGVVFLGGEYLTTYARCGNSDSWNTTTRAGGRYAAFDPEPEVIELARRAQDLFGLDFTGVDVALTDEGPMVFEVSAFGGFRGIETSRQLDPAKLYVDYVLKRLSQ